MASAFNLTQGNNYILTFNLVDEDEDAIPLSILGTLVATQYYYNPERKTSDRHHLATINSRESQDIKNANGVTVSSTSAVTYNITFLDTVKLDSNTDQELHILLITWMWQSKRASHEFHLYTGKSEYVEE